MVTPDALGVRCPICEVAPAEQCERFDPIAAMFVPLGYHHHARTKLAEDEGHPAQLPLFITTRKGI